VRELLMRPAKLCIGALLRRTMSGPMRGDRVRTEARTLRKLSDCTELAEGCTSDVGNNAVHGNLLRPTRASSCDNFGVGLWW
jgi:hypothetical protein